MLNTMRNLCLGHFLGEKPSLEASGETAREKGENPSLTCPQSSRGSAAKKAQHLPLNRQLRRLRRVWVSVPFFVLIPSLSSLHKSPLYQSSAPCKIIILEYEQSLVFLSPSSKTRESRKWPRAWLKARERRGTFLASFLASRARAVPSLNRKEKRDCSQSIIIRNRGNFCFWNPESWALESLIYLLKKIGNSAFANSTDSESGFQYLESEIYRVESSPVLRIQGCLGWLTVWGNKGFVIKDRLTCNRSLRPSFKAFSQPTEEWPS